MLFGTADDRKSKLLSSIASKTRFVLSRKDIKLIHTPTYDCHKTARAGASKYPGRFVVAGVVVVAPAHSHADVTPSPPSIELHVPTYSSGMAPAAAAPRAYFAPS